MEHIEEVESKDKANELIEKHNYRLDKFSETRNCYILVKRLR